MRCRGDKRTLTTLRIDGKILRKSGRGRRRGARGENEEGMGDFGGRRFQGVKGEAARSRTKSGMC